MTENGRKRCRKSKLVPRDCADFVEDELDLQDTAQKKLLQKIKKEVEDVPQDPSLLQFSVKVEIEDMDGSIPDEDPSDYMKYLFSLSKEAHEEETKNVEFADNSLLLEQKLVIPLPEDEKNCIVDIRKTQKLLSILHKKYPEEKEAVMHTRNQWGKAFYDKLPVEFKRTAQETQLQAVIKRWQEWTVISRSRESPYSYKCYVCDNGWWSFAEFSIHIVNHIHCKLGIETKNMECNIVAYESLAPTFKDIDVHGKCLKCGKTYDHHLSNKRGQDTFYYCNYCEERFQTCTSLAKHEGSCPRNPIRVLALSNKGKNYSFSDFSCEVCHTVFMSNLDLMEHMSTCHRVRSDEPIVTKLKTCKTCGQQYFNFNFHPCLRKYAIHECKYCSSKFHTKPMLDIHTTMWTDYTLCRLCDKLLQKSCMAAEHYALHSENFVLANRCLLCKKIKVFFNEEMLYSHKSKYHRRADSRRPYSDKIIMARIMVEQCMIEPVKRTPKILQSKAAPRAKEAKKPDPNKLTRGETVSQVRVYVPVHKKRPTKEDPSENTTTAHDDNLSLRTDPKYPDTIQVKREKIDCDWTVKTEPTDKQELGASEKDVSKELSDRNIVSDSVKVEKSLDSNKGVPKNIQTSEKAAVLNDNVTENSNNDYKMNTDVVIKKEKDSIKENAGKDKDITYIMAELNEFLDIKPDVIKEERISDDETAQATQELSSLMSGGMSKVCAEEVTDNSEHSSVFQISKTVLETVDREEPMDCDPQLDSSSSTKNDTNDSVLNLEPEVILKAGYRKRKTYRCNRCDYSGFHREYKEHITNHCIVAMVSNRLVPSSKERFSNANFDCTKCNKSFLSFKKFVLHFEKHGYRYMSCPQCKAGYDSVSRLIPHVNNHIKNQFHKVQLYADCADASNRIVYQCKACKENVEVSGWFVHWERHLELAAAAAPEGPRDRGQAALHPTSLKEALEVLVQEERSDTLYSKSCILCHRVFERRNDCKRHLIEHLLEDAYANIIDNKNMLKCQLCSEPHKKPDDYKKHMRDHGSLPIYKCGMCNKTFSDSSNFTKHKKIHNLKAFICDICSKKFQAKMSLVKHIEMHMKTDPITCDSCQLVFHDRSFYKRHCRQQHSKGTPRYRCVLCREKFFSLREKWDHMWIVHKQRKEAADCPVCGLAFRKFNDVKKHAQEEHGENISLSNLWRLLSKIRQPSTRKEESDVIVKVESESSDDDCLLIEEERETLVVYD